MREPSHMSVRGAEKLTRALTERVVGPMLSVEKNVKRKKPATTQAASAPTTAPR
jgi:hypothetical protein